MKIGCESLTGNHDDPGQSGREDLNLRLQGSESRVLRPFCRVPADGSSNVSTASSEERCIRKAVGECGLNSGPVGLADATSEDEAVTGTAFALM